MKNSHLKIDLHVHTNYSEDSRTTLKEVIHYAIRQGLDGVAITDHNTTAGALKLVKQKKLVIISGIEITTLHGHVLALNVTKPIASNLDLLETIDKIHQLGGIAVIAHPTVFLKGLRLVKYSAANLDAVEVMNSSAFPFRLTTFLNRRLALRFKLPQTAGSDAHNPQEIGNAYTIIDANPNRDEIVESIKKGRTLTCGSPISWARRFDRVKYKLEKMREKRR